MNEASKNHKRRLQNGDYEKFFKGIGLDIGCGHDPVLPTAVTYDRMVLPYPSEKHITGDAQTLQGFPSEAFDWVHSSHCLEHLGDPLFALRRWWDVVRPGGHLIVTVPDFTLYEKRRWPSRFNGEHVQYFTMGLLVNLAFKLPNAQFVRFQLNDEGFDYTDKVTDQTRSGAQAEIEMILRKVSDTFWATL